MLKKFLIVLGAILGLLVIAAIVVPLVVDVDKYRPQIVQLANQNINGKLELGKLKLSLWGQVRVEVGGLKLSDAGGSPIISVDDAYIHLPLLSLLSGSPSLTFKMDKPAVNIIKNKAGKLNVMSLVKEGAAPAQPSQAPSGGGGGGGSMTLPGLATRAKLSIEIHNANLLYRDQLTGLDSKTHVDLFAVRDISLTRPMNLELLANLDTKLGKTFLLRGPAKITGKANPILNGNHFGGATVNLMADFDQVEMASPGVFEKKKGMAANALFSAVATPDSAEIKQLELKFFNVEIKGTGKLTQLQAKGPDGSANPVVNLALSSNQIEFKPWIELIPMLKDYDLGGSARLNASAEGPAAKLQYQAKLKVDALTAKAPKLKAQPRIDGVVDVATDQVRDMNLTMKAPGNDLRIEGKLVSFSKPHGDFKVTSSGMDLDQLIDFPPPAKKGHEAAPAGGGAGGLATGGGEAKSAKGAPASDYDALLAPLRENEMMRATVANIGVDIKMIKAYQIRLTDINSKMSMKDLVATIDSFGMKLFGGAIHANMTTDLKPKAPTYRFGTQVEALDLKEAVSSQLELFKNTVLGKANFKMEGSGASFNPDPATSNLKAKGNLKVDKATFASIDVAKMASEAVNKAMDRVGEKIPALRGKKIGSPGNKESRYEFISSDFTIDGGRFTAPNFYAKAEPNQGIDLKGDTAVGLKDYGIKATWSVIDTYNFTHAYDLSVDIAGTKVDHILAEKGQPVKFTVTVGGTLTNPQYSYAEVPEYLAKVAFNNTTGAATARAKGEAQKKAEELIKKAPPALQNPLQGLGKKLFH